VKKERNLTNGAELSRNEIAEELGYTSEGVRPGAEEAEEGS